MVAASLHRTKARTGLDDGRTAIIDIGSNSIRLVVYDGPVRIPSILFNEKVMAGLGRGLVRDGALETESTERALTALSRFQRLTRQMGVADVRTVATAAVREASNGAEFIDRIEALGLTVEVLSGENEAKMAGYGVLAGIPDANGIVGDLGGGSLELIRVGDGKVHERISFPLGVLRVAAIRDKGPRALERVIAEAIGESGWEGRGEGLPFYLVGGSWRSLARLEMHLSAFPLPIIHHYRMPVEAPQRLIRSLAHLDKARLRGISGLSASRIPTLGHAAAVLGALVRHLGSSGLVVSAYGLREGLLHQSLPEDVREQDPLICATREEGVRLGRFPEHGDLLDRWIAPLFADECAADARLRHATCLLADVGWRAHPEFRAERGLETALHGNWVGVDAQGRAKMGHALYRSFGGDGGPAPVVTALLEAPDIEQAERWGLAMRLGQRLSGGVAEALEKSALRLNADAVTLALRAGDAVLYGESVERRHKTLAAAFNLKANLSVAG
ncbi:Ppx/GppA family phosphatase [Sphingomonas sp. KC8]|uniref:Ppx/GppA family phosphatase n=1 Tax=Sphingomonas sp. KC8 TaxID=1030157 RepID=UPI0002488EB2|nr:Ppx/GppA family phosphatase [Sphingomonas sp. KC8]ARS25756.1 exopolyphosphatase [Sphingomonas sp. KC8]